LTVSGIDGNITPTKNEEDIDLGGRGGSSGVGGGGLSNKEAAKIAKGLSTPGNQIKPEQIQQLVSDVRMGSQARRQQLQNSFNAKVGKTIPNNAVNLGETLGVTGVRHTGNFAFEGWSGGQRVSIYTEPVGRQTDYGYSRIRITGVRLEN